MGDDQVENHESVWRRVHRDYYIQRKDGPGWRVSQGAFRTNDPQLSIDRVAILFANGLDASFTARDQPGVAEVTASVYRLNGLEPVPDPLLPGDPDAPLGNPAHAVVRAVLTKPQAKALSRACIFVPSSQYGI